MALIYQFDQFSLDTVNYALSANGEEIAVEPQVFSLLQFLVENRDRVVSKDDLIDHVWEGRIVSDGSLTSRINAARRALGDDGKTQAVIRTFPRRGFRFVAEVSDNLSATSGANEMAPATSKPSIAVLPFTNLSGDPEQEYFSDGITDDVITALSRIHSFFVIARNSSFSYKGQSPDVRSVAAELGVKYVLEGSVRRSGNQVRITSQLADAESGTQVWAESYDREVDDIFSLQAELSRTVVGAIEPELAKAEQVRATIAHPDSLSAWEDCQRGMWNLYQMASPESCDQAEKYFLKAVERDPNFGFAYSALAHNSYLRAINGWAKFPDELDIALAHARQGMELDQSDSRAHCCLGAIHIMRKETSKAIRECQTGISLNPSSFQGHMWCGAAHVYAGNFEAAIPFLEMAMRLSPNDPFTGVALARLADAYMGLGKFDLAVEMAELAASKPRRGIWIHAVLVATLAHVGRTDEAKHAFTELIERQPDFSCTYLKQNLPITDPHLLDIFSDGLRKAGVPES